MHVSDNISVSPIHTNDVEIDCQTPIMNKVIE